MGRHTVHHSTKANCVAYDYQAYAAPVAPAREDIGQLGLFFVIPKFRNFTFQAGVAVAWNYASGSSGSTACCLSPTTGVFYRVTANLWQWRGRNRFGNPPSR